MKKKVQNKPILRQSADQGKPIRRKAPQGEHFYSHLIETDTIHIALSSIDLTEEEKKHLVSLVDSSLHHTVMDSILSELTYEDKKQFLSHIASDNHDEVWKFLNNKVDNIEEKIKKAADDLKKKLHEDIDESKKTHKNE